MGGDGGSILTQVRGEILLTCYCIYYTLNFTGKKPWVKSAVLHLLSQESTKTQVTPDIILYSKPLPPGYCILQAQLQCWYSTTCATQILAPGKLVYTQTNKYERNSCVGSDLCQSDYHPVSASASTGWTTYPPGEYETTIPSLLMATHALRCLGKQWFYPDYSYQAWQSHSHLYDSCILHLNTVFADGSIPLTNAKPYFLKVFGDHTWPSSTTSGKTGDTAKHMEIKHPASQAVSK